MHVMCAIWRRNVFQEATHWICGVCGEENRFAGNAAIPRTVGASARATACWFTACHRTPVSAGQGTGERGLCPRLTRLLATGPEASLQAAPRNQTAGARTPKHQSRCIRSGDSREEDKASPLRSKAAYI